MPDDLNLSKWPRWALIVAAGIGMTITGGIGTAIGYKVVDHELRLVRVETTRFTPADGAELVREMKADLRGMSQNIEEIKRDVAVLKARTP